MIGTTTAKKPDPYQDDRDRYPEFLEGLQTAFKEQVKGIRSVFTTDANYLFETFLTSLPDNVRARYNCHACRKFVETYGGLVRISENGETVPVLWDDPIPPVYQNAADEVRAKVCKAKVTGVFASSETTWGTPVTGPWHHMSVKPPVDFVLPKRSLLTPFQWMAERAEEYKMLQTALITFSLKTVEQAASITQSDILYRSEKVSGVAEWFLALHKKYFAAKNRTTRSNILWRAVAEAPTGWCHVRSTMIGTLLDDLENGIDVSTVARRFTEKMHPLKYARPVAPPSVGTIAQAEKIIAELGAAGSLERRFARLGDLQAVWKPEPKQQIPTTGVFGSLLPTNATQPLATTGVTTVTAVKFISTVVPKAKRISFVPTGTGRYLAFTMAVNPDSPVLFQWDNHVSWYTYVYGSAASQWNLSVYKKVDVTALVLLPYMWGDRKLPHMPNRMVAILDGAVDKKTPGLELFPEIMKSEYHGVRSVIEAYSRSRELSGKEQANACGIEVTGIDLEVFDGVLTHNYHIDRWD